MQCSYALKNLKFMKWTKTPLKLPGESIVTETNYNRDKVTAHASHQEPLLPVVEQQKSSQVWTYQHITTSSQR